MSPNPEVALARITEIAARRRAIAAEAAAAAADVRDSRARATAARRHTLAATEQLTAAIHAANQAGAPYRAIAARADLTPGRISQLVHA